jgi:hypothetical protein
MRKAKFRVNQVVVWYWKALESPVQILEVGRVPKGFIYQVKMGFNCLRGTPEVYHVMENELRPLTTHEIGPRRRRKS